MSVIPERRRRKAEINIVPLVDVLVVLIFFFLVSMQFRNLTIMNMTLPKIETAGEESEMENIEIGISEDGTFYFNGDEVSREQLISHVNEAANLAGDIPVIIMADETSLLQQVTFAMDTCRKAGLDKIKLQSR